MHAQRVQLGILKRRLEKAEAELQATEEKGTRIVRLVFGDDSVKGAGKLFNVMTLGYSFYFLLLIGFMFVYQYTVYVSMYCMTVCFQNI